VFRFHAHDLLRRLAPGALAAFVLTAPALVMAQDSTATKPADASAAKATEAPADAKSGETKSGDKTDAEKAKWMSERFDRMTKGLKLTEEQKAKMRPIMIDEMTRARALRTKFEGKLSTPEARAEMEKQHKAIWAEADAKLAQVLSPEQMTELQKMRAEHMKHRWSKDKEEGKKDAGQ
jgi:Spy/CpxP family protein refolding chaperone